MVLLPSTWDAEAVFANVRPDVTAGSVGGTGSEPMSVCFTWVPEAMYWIGDTAVVRAAGGEYDKELLFAVPREHPEVQRLEAEAAATGGLKEGAVVQLANGQAAVLRRVIEENDGPLSDEEMVRLFREIMSACLAQEKPLKVAYLGPEGTFTQAAVLKHFGHSVRALSLAEAKACAAGARSASGSPSACCAPCSSSWAPSSWCCGSSPAPWPPS